MGVILSRFKKKKLTTFQVLEGLDNRIKQIEDFSRDTEQRQRTVVGQLILYSVGLYVLAALIFYFSSFPKNLRGQILCITPLLVFPILIIFLKRLVQWYYHRKINRNQQLLSELKDEKRLMLENVKDHETYKVAKQILEKFAPDQLRKPMPIPMARPGISPTPNKGVPSLALVPSNTPESDLRRRAIGNSETPAPLALRSPSSPYNSPQRPPLPRPIIPTDRSFLDKVVEYLVGDGPSNRYALICKQCHSHNGMALREEFEYLAFQCCYCCARNPARKQRPLAPRLPTLNSKELSASELDSSESTEESDPDQLSGTESQLPDLSEMKAEVEPAHNEETTLSSETGSGDPGKEAAVPVTSSSEL